MMVRNILFAAAAAAVAVGAGAGCATPEPIVGNYQSAVPTRDPRLGNAKLKWFLDAKQTGRELPCSMLTVELPPDETMAFRKLKSDETILVQSGSGVLTVDAQQIPIGPGSVVFIPGGSVQSLYNNGNEPMVYISVIVPAFSEEECEFIKK